MKINKNRYFSNLIFRAFSLFTSINFSKMVMIEIAKLKKVIPKEEIETVIKDYLNKAEIYSHSVILLPSKKYLHLNNFSELIYSICVGDIPVSTIIYKSKLICFN